MAVVTVAPRPTALKLRPGMSQSLALPILAIGLIVAVAWALLAGDWVTGAGGILIVAVASVVEALILIRVTTPTFLAILVAPLLAFAAIVPSTLSQMVPDGDSSLRHAVGRYVVAMIFPRSLYTTDNWMFIVAVATVIWVSGFFLTWMTVRRRLPGIAIFPCFFILAVNALMAPSRDNVALPDMIAGAFAVLIVGATQLRSAAESWRVRRVITFPGTAARWSSTVVVTSLLIIIAGALLPPLTSRDYSGSVLRSISGGDGLGGTGGYHSPVPPVGFSGSTVPGGSLDNGSPHDELRYTTTASSPVYLSLAVDSLYVNGTWQPLPGVQLPLAANQLLGRDSSTPIGDERSTVQLSVTPLAADATTPDIGDGSSTALIPWIGDLVAVNSAGYVATGMLSDDGQMTTVESFQLASQWPVGHTINITSSQSTATAAELRQAGTEYPAAIRTIEQSADGGFDSDGTLARTAAAWTAGATNPYDMAMAIQSHLRDASAFHYTLTPPPTPRGETALTYFLTQSHEGYCQYYASAMAALLRAEGIPSRVINGYANGTLESSGPTGNTFVVSSNDAHSWVQAYFPSYGWVDFEPTPPSQLGDYEPITRGAVPTAGPSSAPQTAKPKPRQSSAPTTPTANVAPAQAPDITTPHPPAALTAGAEGVAVVVLLGIAVLLWLRRGKSLATLWRRVEFFALVCVRVRRDPNETDIGFVRRVIAALPPDTTTVWHRGGDAESGPRPVREGIAQALMEFAELSGKATFSEGGAGDKERVRCLRAWERVLAAAPVVFWRRVISRRTPTPGATHITAS